MKIAAIQLSTIADNRAATLEKAAQAIGQSRDSDLIILPELWPVGFMDFDRYCSGAEDMTGSLVSLLKNLAVKHKVFIHTGSFVEKQGKNYYNTSLLISAEGKILAKYRKIHLFGYKSLETSILTPGRTPVVTDTPFGKIGMATCFDLRFPELFRAMVAKGAQIFLITAAWPRARLEPWRLFNRARAMENQCFLISSNAAGISRSTRFAGHSMVVDPLGTVIGEAGEDETVLNTSIDPETTARARRDFPALEGRVPFLQPSQP